MTIVWLLFISSVIVLPGTALLALRWAARNGEFRNLPRTALSIFDEDEPVGRQTDYFPGHQPDNDPGPIGRGGPRREFRDPPLP